MDGLLSSELVFLIDGYNKYLFLSFFRRKKGRLESRHRKASLGVPRKVSQKTGINIKIVPDINGAYIAIPFDVEAEFGKDRVLVAAIIDGETPYINYYLCQYISVNCTTATNSRKGNTGQAVRLKNDEFSPKASLQKNGQKEASASFEDSGSGQPGAQQLHWYASALS